MYNPTPIPSILRTYKTKTDFTNVLRLLVHLALCLNSHCHSWLSNTSVFWVRLSSWRSDESYTGHGSEKGIAEHFLGALSTEEIQSLIWAFTKDWPISLSLWWKCFSLPIKSNTFLFSISTFLGNIPIFFTKAGRYTLLISISLQLIFFSSFFFKSVQENT